MRFHGMNILISSMEERISSAVLYSPFHREMERFWTRRWMCWCSSDERSWIVEYFALVVAVVAADGN